MNTILLDLLLSYGSPELLNWMFLNYLYGSPKDIKILYDEWKIRKFWSERGAFHCKTSSLFSPFVEFYSHPFPSNGEIITNYNKYSSTGFL